MEAFAVFGPVSYPAPPVLDIDPVSVLDSQFLGCIRMDIEKLPAGYNATLYPIGYRHTRLPLSADRQPKWIEPMYYLPFNTEDNFKMKNFVPNVVW